MILLDGKKTARTIKEEIAIEVINIKASGGKVPHLAALIVGADAASQTYVNSKVKACGKVGFNSTLIDLPDTITEEQLLHEIELLNKDAEIDGYIVQLPLPKHIDENKILMAIDPSRDVDFDSVSEKVAYITPVPGGVGPMTIAMLLKNTLLAVTNK